MIPFQAIITPLFMVLKTLHLNNSLIGLTIVYITFNLPFGLFIMRNSFAAVPDDVGGGRAGRRLRHRERAAPHHAADRAARA